MMEMPQCKKHENIFVRIKKKYDFWRISKSYNKMLMKNLSMEEPDEIELFSDAQLNDERELLARNHYYSVLLKSYIKYYNVNQTIKHKRKWQFYNIVVVSFVLIMLLLIAMSVFVTIIYKEDQTTVIISYLSSFIGLFASLIIIPQTITKYLFNPLEDKNIAQMVVEMQKQDIINRQVNNAKGNSKDAASNRTASESESQ